jgi:4-amino-4-deoxy-L-arabinose transferase-like glycosyltransferase
VSRGGKQQAAGSKRQEGASVGDLAQPLNVDRRADRWALAAILALALALRLAYVSCLEPGSAFASIDAQGYRILALNLVEHGVLSLRTGPPFVPDGLRTPLYPAFLTALLVATRDAPLAVPITQALIDTGTAGLVYCLGCRLAGRRRGRIAALTYALNPVSFLFIGEALTEVLLAFLLALTFCVFLYALAVERRALPLMLAAGLLSAACILCKPNVLVLPLILALGWIVDRRRVGARTWAEAGALVAAALLALTPWVIRNQLTLGRPVLSLAFEDNLAHVSAVATVLEAQGERAAPWTPRWEQVYMESVVVPAARQGAWPEGEPPKDGREASRRSAEMATVARSILQEHPRAFLVAHLRGTVRSLIPELHRYWYAALTGRPWPVTESLQDALSSRQGVWQALGDWWGRHSALARGLWVTSMTVSAAGLVLLVAGAWALRRRPVVLLSFGLLFFYLVLLPGPIGYVRFWMPGVPLAVAVMACAFRPPR